ncbi:MAG: hypothetical protein U0U67_11550 [Chitinophagales bacterium]
MSSFQTIEIKKFKPTVTVLVKNWEKVKGTNCLNVKVSLHNNSADTLFFYNMSCSWEDIYRINSKGIKIYNESICFRNSPVIVKLAPFKSYDNVLKLYKDVENKKNSMVFSIGLNLVEVKPNDYFFKKWRELDMSKNIIWSNSITVK